MHEEEAVNKLIITALAVTLTLAAACNHPEVVQGTVVALSEDGANLTLHDELAPHHEFVISIKGADVGAAPAVGDVVRIAFYQRGEERAATRVMNLTRQAELAKKH